MKLTTVCWLISLVTTAVAAPAEDAQQAAARQQFSQLEKKYQDSTIASTHAYGRKCSAYNIQKRQEWGTLSKQQRLDYINAVKCLQRKPAKISKQLAAGARSRFDDFVAVHIIQTPYVHNDGLFLAWHRYLLHIYEKALREECGYKGYQPYWDWTISYQDPSQSTVFDGSPYSLSGNGEAVPHGPTTLHFLGHDIQVPPGSGGGCVTSGPFASPKYYNVSLGPVATDPQGPNGGLGSNERCWTRDLNSLVSSNSLKPTDILNLVSSCTDLGCWDNILEGPGGVHGSGHVTMGGPGMDPYAANNDPAFYLHHANVDRMWAIWQGQNLRNRTNQVWGTQTGFNQPPSAPATLATVMDFGVLGPKQTIGSAVSPVDGPFCYLYV